MHERVMNIHYKTWIAQGRFTNIILTPSKQWRVCDKITTRKIIWRLVREFWEQADVCEELLVKRSPDICSFLNILAETTNGFIIWIDTLWTALLVAEHKQTHIKMKQVSLDLHHLQDIQLQFYVILTFVCFDKVVDFTITWKYQFRVSNPFVWKATGMMTSSNGNIFCVTGHLCQVFIGVNSPQ